MKKFLVFLFSLTVILSLAFMSACGFTSCSNSDYGRQQRAMKQISAEEDYKLCSYEYIGGYSVSQTIKKYLTSAGKETNKSDIVRSYLLGDDYYALYNYFSSATEENSGSERYKNYLLCRINCINNNITPLRFDTAEIIYSYDNPCSITRWNDGILYRAGGDYYLFEGQTREGVKVDLGEPDRSFYPSYGGSLILSYGGIYAAINADFESVDLGVDSSEYVYKGELGGFAFFTSGDYKEEKKVIAADVSTGERVEGEEAENLLKNLSSAQGFTIDGDEYLYTFDSESVTFTCGESVTEITAKDMRESVPALGKIEEIYGKSFYFKQVFARDGEVFLVMDNPPEYNWVLLPNLLGYGVEYAVSAVFKCDLTGGGCKYVGFYPDNDLLMAVYKN